MNKPTYESALSPIIDLYLKRCEISFSVDGLKNYYLSLLTFDRHLLESGYTGGEISMETINAWTVSLQPRSKSTINLYQKIVFRFLEFAAAFNISSTAPDKVNVSDEYIPHIYTEEERTKLLSAAESLMPLRNNPNPFIKVVLPMAIRILDCCGTRETETLRLQMKDVDLDRGIITMKHAKANKERLVPMHPTLTELLRKYCMAMGITASPNAYLFPGKSRDEPLDSRSFRGYFRRLLAHAEINVSREQKYQRAACPHDLRHSFACRSLENLLQNGVDEDDAYPYLSTYIGHEDLYSTQRYLKYPTERMGEDVAKHETYVEEIYNSVPIFQEDISAWTK